MSTVVSGGRQAAAMTSSTNSGDLSLVPDDAEGGAIAVRHLLSTGRTRIGHVTGPMSFAASRLRAEGAERTLAAAGLELAAGGAMYGEWTEEWGRQAAGGLLRAAPDLDAIFCGNDQIARGVPALVPPHALTGWPSACLAGAGRGRRARSA